MRHKLVVDFETRTGYCHRGDNYWREVTDRFNDYECTHGKIVTPQEYLTALVEWIVDTLGGENE